MKPCVGPSRPRSRRPAAGGGRDAAVIAVDRTSAAAPRPRATAATRPRNPLNDGQARTAPSAALLRQLFVMISTRAAWNPTIAAGRKANLDAA